ncbi:two-component system sensor histidine kinase DcuS [Bacillus sp. AFS015802]|uniref:DcuS/MalK family sensor histidine kinase n=1 Tax=Bacillus sp. AFS015802 TaxID=2033486 RepID=UPI000BF921B8|nr:DcuS/MalK family sensor histidine kinase [Bacillus sp. AFS015802]PFA66478.1 two-component system sensor histidine kinase DcuS [Bacillus sp. AFS015802]
MKKKKLRLSTLIILFVCVVVLVSLVMTDLLISRTINDNIETNIEDKAKIVSRTVAHSTIVKNGLENKENEDSIQEYTLDIQESAEVLFVVVMDMKGIRKSHPDPDRIGKHFVGGDEKDVLEGKESLSISEGTLGKSVRAFSPVYNEQHEQIGAVSVGISLNSVEEALDQSHSNILLGTGIGIVVGVVGAVIIARYIKKILFGLEPIAIAKVLEERNTMLQSVHEGVVAVNKDSTISLVNKSALKIFNKAGLSSDPIGVPIEKYMPHTRLKRVMETGKPELDEEQTINGVSILVNRVPLFVNDEVVGAISTFRDKTEVNQLAEQLTGVKSYAEALRAQSHEFMNKMHVILGLVKMNDYNHLERYVKELVSLRFDEVSTVTSKVKDPALAGFIMGKLSYAREKSVSLTVECHDFIPEPKDPSVTHELITVIGNLLDNSIEATMDRNEKEVLVELFYQEDQFEMVVTDTGIGMPDDMVKDIFTKGYSSKGDGRGYGLFLVKESLGKLNGTLHVESKEGSGTTMIVQASYKEGNPGD